MAKATINFKTEKTTEEKVVVTEVTREVPHTVTLELTLDEARTLRTVLRVLGGDPDTTLRGNAKAVGIALKDSGVGYHDGKLGFTSQSDVFMDGANRLIFAQGSRNVPIYGENFSAPKESRKDICGSTKVVPELRVGAKIRITDPDYPIGYKKGEEFIVEGVNSVGGANFTNSAGERAYAYRREFEVIG